MARCQGRDSARHNPAFPVPGCRCYLAGTRPGMKFYGHLDETTFRKIVLVLLLASGAVLIF